MKYSFLKFICWSEHWQLCETSEIRVVRGEPGANLQTTFFHLLGQLWVVCWFSYFVRGVRLFWGMVVRGCAHRDLC